MSAGTREGKTKAYLFALKALLKLDEGGVSEAKEQLDGLPDKEFAEITFKEIREGVEHWLEKS